ncbi:MAG: tRNA uridine(34) 5-carboxymethylaminomethyl modification radical SAM/GNAT enzyme Elp3 [Bacteroidales bacterium]|nr:tRNA uridine(34) 5-carboxymethylaminomethyl modification radical SAM/GNAT enzyme Elp3 [Bacteroidales bacterium]
MKKEIERKILIVQKMAKEDISSEKEFEKVKQKTIAKIKMTFPPNNELLMIYKKLKKENNIHPNFYFEKLLKKRPIRSLSGVAIVAVLTKPWPCPGKCIYCPSEKNIPQSYLSGEPAVERAKTLNYDPYLQTKKRIEMLENNGHPVDKIELIVIGGTWSYLPKHYQTWFIKRCFDGANKKMSKTLAEAQKINERAKHRLIGITLETRPDYITPQEILRMRKLGCTRVEIGVQIADDQILKINQRGHFIEQSIKATKLLKDAGFKICYHIMPGLFGSNPKKDLKRFEELFSNPGFQPDMLKIYPCVVTKGSKLYKLWKEKKYKPYNDKQLINLLVKMKSSVPPYVRINRVVRDIPSWQIQAGSRISNMRQYLKTKMKEEGLECQCIRCREIKSSQFKLKDLKLKRQEYIASNGQEIFLSFEGLHIDQKSNNRNLPPHLCIGSGGKLAAFLRLRLPSSEKKEQPSVLNGNPIIREIHTYGQLVSLKQKNNQAAQHFGLGKKLIQEAEKISKKAGYKKIAVIAGIGVRPYYRKLGYRLKETYMMKML